MKVSSIPLVSILSVSLLALMIVLACITNNYAAGLTLKLGYGIVGKFGTPGTSPGQFQAPTGIAAHSGNVFVADTLNNRIQVFTSDTFSYREEWAGPEHGFNHPTGLAVSQHGLVAIADTGNNRVLLVHPQGGTVFAELGKEGNEPGTANGEFNQPRALAFAPIPPTGETRLYVADTGNNRIQVFELNNPCPPGKPEVASGVCFHYTFGTTGSENGQFKSPIGIETIAGKIIVLDAGNYRIQVWEDFCCPNTLLKSFGTKGTDNGQFIEASGIARFSGSDVLHVTDSFMNRIQEFTMNGIFKEKWGQEGNDNRQFNQPGGIAADKLSEKLFVADTGNHRVQVFKYLEVTEDNLFKVLPKKNN